MPRGLQAVPGVPEVTLVGHPFAPIGRGEDLRSVARALRRVAVDPKIIDVFGSSPPETDLMDEFGPSLHTGPAGQINVFLINGDEVEPVLERLDGRIPASAYNVVAPVWELARYPDSWARLLERFDEVWVPSTFVQQAVAPAVSKPVELIPWPNGVGLRRCLGRRAFGLRESSYLFLFAFDLRSFVARKNPLAALEAFERLERTRPRADVSLAVKISGGRDPARGGRELVQQIHARAAACPAPVIVIDRDLLDHEAKSLLLSCDAFVSLHRSEGFGRLLAESMLLAKPVIATGYSGNMEFMTPETAILIPHRLVDVRPGEYPFWEGQVWAEPDVEAAARAMVRLVDEPDWGRGCGERASRHIRTHFGHRAIGLRYLDRLDKITAATAGPSPKGEARARAS